MKKPAQLILSLALMLLVGGEVLSAPLCLN